MVQVSKYIKVFLALAVFVTASFPFIAKAESNIAVVDIQRLLEEARVSAHVAKQLADYRKKAVTSLEKKEKSLIEMEKKLVDERNELSKEEFSKRVEAFEKDRMAFQKENVGYRRSLTEASEKAERQIMDEVLQIVAKIAEENSYDLVITRQHVLIGSNDLDVTDITLERLNKALPKVSVDIE